MSVLMNQPQSIDGAEVNYATAQTIGQPAFVGESISNGSTIGSGADPTWQFGFVDVETSTGGNQYFFDDGRLILPYNGLTPDQIAAELIADYNGGGTPSSSSPSTSEQLADSIETQEYGSVLTTVFDANGLLSFVNEPTPTTSDLNSTDLYSLLLNAVGQPLASDLETWASNHLPVDGLTPVETDPVLGDTINSLILDPENTHPQFLQVSNGTTIDTSNLGNLKGIFVLSAGYGDGTGITVNGSGNEHIYTQDTAINDAGSYTLQMQQSTGNVTVVMGNDNGDIVYGGSGTEHITMGNGNADQVHLYGEGTAALGNGIGDVVYISGNNETATLGTGTSDSVQIASGLQNDTVTFRGATTFQDAVNLVNLILTDKVGGSSFNIGDATSETIHLGGSANNRFTIQSDPLNNATIEGVSSTDTFHFADSFADATITTNTTNHTTTVAFASGQTVNLTGTHDAATFAGDPSIHYI